MNSKIDDYLNKTKNWQKELFGFWSNGNVTSFTEEQGWTRNYGILTDCGFDFYNIKNLTKSIVKKSDEIKEQLFTMKLNNIKTRYVKVIGKRVDVCPEWHEAAGSKAWIFIDEIIIK
jgi:hypothetical protein